MHAFLRSDQGDLEDPSESVIFGKTTVNQIERWLMELHDHFEKYVKEQLVNLLEQGHYDLQNEVHRNIIAYVYIPVLREKCIYLSQTGTMIVSDSRKILFYRLEYQGTFIHFLKNIVLRDVVYLYLRSNYSRWSKYQNS